MLGGITLVFAGLVALVAAYILHMDSRTIKADLYRYEAGRRCDYPGFTRVLRFKNRFILKNGDNEFVLTSAPLYYKDRERLFIPRVMAAYRPAGNEFGKLSYFSELYREQDGVFLENAQDKTPWGDGFLYDGSDLYLFIEKTNVTWNGNMVVMEPFSYAIVIYDNRLELYPFQGGPCILEDTGKCMVMAELAGGYSINMSTDIFRRADGKEQMLFSQPSALKELK